MELVENITWQGVPLAYIIRSQLNPAQTTFVTPPQFKQQVGFVVYPAGGEIQRHVHRPLERHLVGTSEVLIVRRGRCEIDIYNNERELVATRELRAGRYHADGRRRPWVSHDGGHGFSRSKARALHGSGRKREILNSNRRGIGKLKRLTRRERLRLIEDMPLYDLEKKRLVKIKILMAGHSCQ